MGVYLSPKFREVFKHYLLEVLNLLESPGESECTPFSYNELSSENEKVKFPKVKMKYKYSPKLHLEIVATYEIIKTIKIILFNNFSNICT